MTSRLHSPHEPSCVGNCAPCRDCGALCGKVFAVLTGRCWACLERERKRPLRPNLVAIGRAPKR